MAIDRYQVCPCGSGKKIKFCCCKDLLAELEKIQRMLEGEQRTACLEYIDDLLAKHSGRPALLCVKAMLETQLDLKEQAEQTIARLNAEFPDNAVGHAERAFSAGVRGDAEAAVDALQDALERLPAEAMPARVYEAIGLVGEALLRNGMAYAGRAHLLLQAGMGGPRDTRAMSLLMRLGQSDDLPLLLKDDPDFIEPPQDAAWAKSAEQALDVANHARWRKAAEAFRQITTAHPQAADAWRNLATLEGVLGRSAAAVEALRTYSQLEVPFDDAVEAAALAKLLDRNANQPMVDLVKLVVEINDLDKLIEIFSSSKQVSPLPINPADFASEEGPPPRMGVLLLDKPLPAGGADLTAEQVPNIAGETYIYGRRTDREARLELHCISGEQLVAARAALGNLADDQLDLPGKIEVVGQIAEVQAAVAWNWRMPEDTPREVRQRLLAQRQQETILNRWTRVAMPELDGKSPAEVAGDARLAIPLEANVLLLELSSGLAALEIDFVELRQHLQLPQPAAVDPTGQDVTRIPIARLHRVIVDRLDDEQLISCFQRAASNLAVIALRKLAAELVARPSIEAASKADACGLVAQVEHDSLRTLQWIERGKQFAEAAGNSPAEYLLAELGVRLTRGDVPEAEALLRTLQTRHINEPGIAQALYSMLAEMGIIDPNQAPRGGQPGGRPAAASQPAAAPQEAPSGLWTPGGPQPTGDQPKKFWTPDD
ncbi:MAG: hypothetical protein WEA31_05750 [Pirellulales bacterium]